MGFLPSWDRLSGEGREMLNKQSREIQMHLCKCWEGLAYRVAPSSRSTNVCMDRARVPWHSIVGEGSSRQPRLEADTSVILS